MAIMLARQVLGLDEYEQGRDHVVPFELGDAHAQVHIELRSMLRGMTQKIWIQGAGISKLLEDQLREACSEVSLSKAIAYEVKQALNELHRDIAERVRKEIDKRVQAAIAERLGDTPRRLADQIATEMTSELIDRTLGLGRKS